MADKHEGMTVADKAGQETEKETPRWAQSAVQRWHEDVEHWRAVGAGEEECGCGGSRQCRETGIHTDRPRDKFAGWYTLEEGSAVLAAWVGDIEARGGLELLPERSRRFLEALRDGLGEKLYAIVDAAGELEEDVAKLGPDVWPTIFNTPDEE
jgi:hypothetical protein